METFFFLSSLLPKRAICKKRALCSATLTVRSSSFESHEGTQSSRWTKLGIGSMASAMRAKLELRAIALEERRYCHAIRQVSLNHEDMMVSAHSHCCREGSRVSCGSKFG